ncbi:MAG: glycoside hydrolase family 16 protein [Paludibacteraceae bacterium]
MNLFWKRLFRVVQSTSAFEKKIDSVQTTVGSDEQDYSTGDLQDKAHLEELVNSIDFRQKKELYKSKKYKDTDENRIMRQYEKLLNDPNIKLYFETKNSDLLNQYLNFKSNPESLNLKNLSILDVSAKIDKLKAFEQSKEYKNYTQYHDSLAVREFEELKKKISEPEFQQANAFWANPDRWETTREYRLEQRYRELTGEQISSPGKRNKSSLFRKYASVRLTFSERFDWDRMENSRWSAGFHSGNPRLVGNYSYVNELQANNNGRNVSTSDGILTIHTVELPSRSLAWDVQKGFVEKQYEYASDVIQTSAAFRQKYGVFSAKIRCSGPIHHALWLSGEKKLPHINIFHFDGSNITMGNANQHKMDGVEIKGIPESQFYIYTLEWTPRTLVWYVNNLEVYRTTENVPQEVLYVGINSFIPAKTEPAPGKLEVDWIKVWEVRE